MQVATRMVDRLLGSRDLSKQDAARFKQTLRLAVLFHDLGHPPMGHVSERVMGPVSKLELQDWVDNQDRKANHEDYTVKLLIDSELSELIEKYFGDAGITGPCVAALVAGRPPPGSWQ